MKSFTLREWNIHLVLETFEPVISLCSLLPFGNGNTHLVLETFETVISLCSLLPVGNGTFIWCWKLLRL